MTGLVGWPLLALCLTAGGIWALLQSGLAARLALDQPTARSLHADVMPRSGGIVMLAAIAATALPAVGEMPPTLGIALLLAALSWLDDRHRLAVAPRLMMHLACATLYILFLSPAHASPIVVFFFLVLLLAWSANLYNFMDGSNGLAGGAACIGFGLMGVAFLQTGHPQEATLCWIVSLAALGFLFFNAGPARIFMGDAGSIPLGFLAGSHAIVGWQKGAWPAWLPLLIFAPLVVDATLTLARRVMRREAFWQPHRDHAYQRLVRMGWSHGRVALGYHGWMLAGGAAAFVLQAQLPPTTAAWLAAGWLALTAALHWFINRRWAEFVAAGR